MLLAISPLLPIYLGGLIALGCLVGAFRALCRKRLIDDSPTSKTQGVFIGLTEVKGTAETETPLTSYLARVQCVQYTWQVQEHWTRTVHETYIDAQGKTHTRTRTESGWSTVAKDSESTPFYLKDDTGIIRILPEGASIGGERTFDETVPRGNPLYFGKGPTGEVANSDHRRRFIETAIPLHALLYVMGQARERQDTIAAEIAYDKNAPMFVISTRTEKQVSRSFSWHFALWLTGGLVISLGTAPTWQTLQPSGLTGNFLPYLIAAGGFLIAIALGWLWTVYNSFTSLHHRVEQAWSQVDVQLKRRHDLIPSLVQVVEGYAAHEKEVQTLISQMRAELTATPSATAASEVRSLTASLRVTVERYPVLKASESFLQLQKSLVDTEERIALARDYFNEIATFYNTRLEVVPDRLVGALVKLHPRPLMNAMGFERAPVVVKLVS